MLDTIHYISDIEPTKIFDSDFKSEFIRAIGNILPHGGGDCPEMSIKAIIEALNAGVKYGSPIFVITDASPKDATADNMLTAEIAAQSLGC